MQLGAKAYLFVVLFIEQTMQGVQIKKKKKKKIAYNFYLLKLQFLRLFFFFFSESNNRRMNIQVERAHPNAFHLVRKFT